MDKDLAKKYAKLRYSSMTGKALRAEALDLIDQVMLGTDLFRYNGFEDFTTAEVEALVQGWWRATA